MPRKHPTVATRASRDLPSRYASGLRVVIVTLGLALAGMAAGGLTAILFVAVFNLLTTGHVPVDVAIVVAPGAIGGALGLIIGPVLAWTLMRSVPIGLAILSSSIGAGLGAAIGYALGQLNPGVGGAGILGGAVVGALGGALAARHRWSRSPSSSSGAGVVSDKSS